MDYAYNSSSDSKYKEGISIQKSVVIDGKGFTLDSTNQAKLFDVKSNGNLTLKNIVLINNNPVTASGIKNAGNLTFDNVTFTTQKQSTGGTFNAAIVNEGTFTIINSNFKDSFINSTGSIFYVYGLLIKNSGNLSIENTNFTNNGIFARASTVQIQGGLIYNSRNLSLNRVTMNNSYIRVNATISGFFGFILGISDSSNISVNSSHFENSLVANDAKTNNAMTNVLRITNGDATVLNSRFINNSGSLNGGAIGNYAESAMLVENCLFESNSVTIQGGAIFAQSNVTSKNNTFRNNFAGRNGGAIYIYGFYDAGNPDLGNFISANDLFEYNWVESSPDAYGEASILSWGGAICSKAGNLTITNDTFYRNKALMGD
jgi:predicted outer membrane repeat protein